MSDPELPDQDATGVEELSQRLRAARRSALLGGETTPSASTPTDSGLDALILRTAEVYAQALAPKTRSDYARRWRSYEKWAKGRRLQALPSSAETVMLYLAESSQGEDGMSLSTLRGRLAAINRVHVEAGFTAPGDDPAMGMLMRGLGRVLDRSPRLEPMSALRIADVRETIRLMPAVDPAAVRDRALLALTAAGLSPEDLSHMRWEDVDVSPHGVSLALRQRLSGPAARNFDLQSRSSEPGCAVGALLAWREIAGGTPPHAFTRVDQYGRRETRYLHPSDIRRITNTRLDSLGPRGNPATLEHAVLLLSGPSNLVLRDRVIILLGFAAAARRPELTSLRWADLRDEPGGVVVRIRRSKMDPAGQGRDVGIPFGRSDLTCPVQAVHAWRARMQAQLGDAFTEARPVLPGIGRAGRIRDTAITPEGLTRVVKTRAEDARLSGHWGGRSLRAGLISTAADLDIPLELIARQSRHASLDNLIKYIRTDDPFRRNAAGSVGL